MARYILQRKVKTEWGPNLAYAIGLITSDGNLSLDGRHMSLTSGEIEMVQNFKSALNLKNAIGKYAGGKGRINKKYFYIHFGDKVFYQFLNTIGLTSAKSKTIKSVSIPDDYFSDFIRGLFDGDGTFYTFQDKRWPNSYGYQISFASASSNFIVWLKDQLRTFYGVRGFIRLGAGVYNLRYVKNDSIKLFFTMYKKDRGPMLLLKRKYDKITNVLSKDRLFKNKYAELAHR